MAQSQATTQGTKRRYSGFSSPQTSHAEEPEARRRPPNPPPGATNGLQPPQVGVSVVTVDMFREYQNQVLAEFDRQSNQIAALRERTQAMESRVQSLEDAEDMAIDAVRDIRDGVLPRVDGHQESLDALSTAVARHNTLLEALGSQGQEDRSSQRRDAPARTPLPSWRPGLLGNATDSTKSTMEEVKAQIAKNLASLTDHERHLEDNDSCLGNHRRHLADHEKRLGGHDTRITALDKHLSEHMIHRLAQDRRCGEHNARLTAQEGHIRDHDMCVAKHNERLGALDKAGEKLSGRIFLLEQRSDHGLSPVQISAILQNHQQRLESLEHSLQRHNKAAETIEVKPYNPSSRRHSASGQTQPSTRQPCSESASPGQAGETFERARQSGKEAEEQREETNQSSELKRLSEHLEGVERRIGPLEERMRLMEKKATPTTESVTADPLPEDGQYEILRRTNFQNAVDLAGLRANEDSPLLMQLFSEEDKCEDACYTVQRACVHMWSYLICRNRNDERLISDFWKREEWKNYPAVIELERSAAMPKDKYFPRYFYEIGEIFNRKVVTKSSGRQATHRSTGYHLVVDVTKPEKSLWLVYRYAENHSDGQSLKRSITYKQDLFWHPFASVCEFDIAMVFERFEDWKGTDTPVGGFAAAKRLVRQTAALIRPTFVEPVLEEVKEEIRQSWEVGAGGSRKNSEITYTFSPPPRWTKKRTETSVPRD